MAAFDASSIAPLGTLLGGGGPNLENAFEEGRYRSAQTEQALQSAAVSQQAAIRQKQENDAITAFKASNPDFQNLQNSDVKTIVLGGLGANLNQTLQGAKQGQEIGFRNTAANPDASALIRTRALQAIQGTPSSDLHPLGEHGFVDLTKDNAQPQALGNEFATPSDAEKNFKFAQSLPNAPGQTGPRTAQDFTPFVRNPLTVDMGGGARSIVDPMNPNAAPKPVISPEDFAKNKATVTAATTTAADTAKKTVDRQFDFPTATARLGSADQAYDKMISTAQQVRNDPQLWQATGPGDVISKIPGTSGADIRAKINILKSQAVLGAINQLRDDSKTGAGIGRITNAELPLLQNKMAALDATQSVGAFRTQLDDFINAATQSRARIHQTFNDTYPESQQAKTPTAPAGGPAIVKSDADYNALATGATFVAPDGTTRTKP